jgi:hypothetical protein
MEVLRAESGRLAAENSELHLQLIREAERFDRAEKDHYQTVKRLEDRLAELSYWKHQAASRMQALERDNAALRARGEELLSLADRVSKGVRGFAAGALDPMPWQSPNVTACQLA